MARKSKPWAVFLYTPGGPMRTEHRSKPKAYRVVSIVREQAKAGTSRVTKIRVEQWEPDYNRWITYDLIDPKES